VFVASEYDLGHFFLFSFTLACLWTHVLYTSLPYSLLRSPFCCTLALVLVFGPPSQRVNTSTFWYSRFSI